jgi:hypothetical protein
VSAFGARSRAASRSDHVRAGATRPPPPGAVVGPVCTRRRAGVGGRFRAATATRAVGVPSPDLWRTAPARPDQRASSPADAGSGLAAGWRRRQPSCASRARVGPASGRAGPCRRGATRDTVGTGRRGGRDSGRSTVGHPTTPLRRNP